jgi:hypothetical protein
VAGFPDNTLDAVAGETPASAATSLMVMEGPVTAVHLIVELVESIPWNRFHKYVTQNTLVSMLAGKLGCE